MISDMESRTRAATIAAAEARSLRKQKDMAEELRGFGWEVQEPRYAQRSEHPLSVAEHRLHGRRLSSAGMTYLEIRKALDRSVQTWDSLHELLEAAEAARGALARGMSRRACTDHPDELSWENDGNHLYRVRLTDLWTPAHGVA